MIDCSALTKFSRSFAGSAARICSSTFLASGSMVRSTRRPWSVSFTAWRERLPLCGGAPEVPFVSSAAPNLRALSDQYLCGQRCRSGSVPHSPPLSSTLRPVGVSDRVASSARQRYRQHTAPHDAPNGSVIGRASSRYRCQSAFSFSCCPSPDVRYAEITVGVGARQLTNSGRCACG